MPYVPGLRSPYALVGPMIYFGRMLDKIRLAEHGRLPEDYRANYGDAKDFVFDARCCRFLRLPHAEVVGLARSGAGDEEVLEAVWARAGRRDAFECDMWNRFFSKIGWRDERSDILRERCRNLGLPEDAFQSGLDFLEHDEGREPFAGKPWFFRPIHTLLVMGVAGSGKSTVGEATAKACGWDFVEADAYHPPANVAKLAAGTPLTDADREPWLHALKTKLDEQAAAGRRTVLACSALRDRYRAILAPDLGFTRVVHLTADTATLDERLRTRPGHFMPASLLPSQLATLEKPDSALHIDSREPLDAIVARIRKTFSL